MVGKILPKKKKKRRENPLNTRCFLKTTFENRISTSHFSTSNTIYLNSNRYIVYFSFTLVFSTHHFIYLFLFFGFIYVFFLFILLFAPFEGVKLGLGFVFGKIDKRQNLAKVKGQKKKKKVRKMQQPAQMIPVMPSFPPTNITTEQIQKVPFSLLDGFCVLSFKLF